MARLAVDFHSEVLDLDTAMTVLLPEHPSSPVGVLYLLHGGSNDHTSWTRLTGIERYAEGQDLAVVMPAGHHGYWTDPLHGPRYWTFVSEELPGIVERLFGLTPPREHTFAAGLSRGGYGALKLGLRHPERFAAVAGLSAKVDVANAAWITPEREHVFGDPDRTRRHGDDLLTLAAAGDPATCPRLLLWCGTADPFLGEARRFRDLAAARHLPVELAEGSGGHEWPVWDRDVQALLQRIAALRAPG